MRRPGPSIGAKRTASTSRVAERVRQGGHSIPDEVVARRYASGLINLRRLYLPLADVAVVYDNSGAAPKLIAERLPDAEISVYDPTLWRKIEEAGS